MGPQHTGNPDVVGRELERSLARLDLSGRRVLVAASGGLDSSVLAHALVQAPGAHAPEIVLGHVHHGLRGPEADADERAVEDLARDFEIAFLTRRIHPESLREGRSSRERPTLQEAARALRYAALDEMAEACGADRIATAHHADDQAETVLLRLFRGTGPDGLAGIPERSADGRVVRPLLRVSRAEIEAYARSQGLAWREDSSNRSTRYARNRLRHDWLPSLSEAFNPRLLRAIGDLAEAQRKDSEWIAACVASESERRFSVEGADEAGGGERAETWLRIDAKDWSALPEALARRVAREAMIRAGAGRHTSRIHLGRIQEFLCNARPGSCIELPGALRMLRDREGIRLGPLPAGPAGGPRTAC